jgi:hypothetical protein
MLQKSLLRHKKSPTGEPVGLLSRTQLFRYMFTIATPFGSR